jgi:trimeric autotransporter adhesin
MKTLCLATHISRSLLRSGFFILAIALCCFALSPALEAGCPNPPGVCGGQNTAVGEDALFNVTSGVWNVGVGVQALFNDTDGNQNTGVGYKALFNNVSGDKATAIGSQALFSNTTGNENVAVGFDTLFSNVDGNRNTGMGYRTLAFNASGNDNTATGWNALFNNRGTASFNTADGSQALLHNNSGVNNTAIGAQALQSSVAAFTNVAVGTFAAQNNDSSGTGNAVFNTAVGGFALQSNIDGARNTAVGAGAMESGNPGSDNTAVGEIAGVNLTGNSSTCIGSSACSNTTSANNVVCLGAFAAGENFSNRAYIPNVGQFSQAFSGGTVEFVTVRLSDGKLGHAVSSRRYKEDIKTMGDASELIYKLKPMTFRYKEVDVDPKKGPQQQNLDYGLIAEDVAEVDPKLAIRDGKGQIESLRYMAIYNMMLNEFLKEHKKVEEQQASIADLKSTVALQQKEMQVLTAQLKEQAGQIQKVSARLEVNKSAPQVVANKP